MTPKQVARKEEELAKLVARIRAKGYSLKTEDSYVPTVAKFMDFLCSRNWRAEATAEEKVEAFLTRVALDGAHLRDLQEVLGHKNVETTARYVRPDPERVPSPFDQLKLTA